MFVYWALKRIQEAWHNRQAFRTNISTWTWTLELGIDLSFIDDRHWYSKVTAVSWCVIPIIAMHIMCEYYMYHEHIILFLITILSGERCMCINRSVLMCEYVYACWCVCVCVCVCVCLSVCLCLCVSVSVCICVWNSTDS